MRNPQVELNVTIYDSLNDRYITPEAVSENPNGYICEIEEYNEFFEEILYIGRQLFTRGELERIIRRG